MEYLDKENPQTSKIEYLDEQTPGIDIPPKQPQQDFISSLLSILGKTGQTMKSALPSSQQPLSQIPGMNIYHAVTQASGQIKEQAKETTGFKTPIISDLLFEPMSYVGGMVGGKSVGSGIGKIREATDIMSHAENLYGLADKARKGIQGEIAILRNATKDTAVEVPKIQTVIDDLFKSKLEQPTENVIFPEGFHGDLSNALKPGETGEITLDNIYKLKDTISKHIKPTTWGKFKIGEQVSPDQEKLIQTYFKFDKFIDETLGNSGLHEEKQMLDYLNQKATDVYDLTRNAKKMVTGSSNVVRDPSKLVGAFMGGSETAGKRGILEHLAEIEPKVNEVIDNMNMFRKTQQTKTLLKRFGMLGLGLEGLNILRGR